MESRKLHSMATGNVIEAINSPNLSMFPLQVVLALKSKSLSVLEPEFATVLDSIDLPEESLKQGIRPRTRTRRNFSFDKGSPEKKKDDGEANAVADGDLAVVPAVPGDQHEKKDAGQAPAGNVVTFSDVVGGEAKQTKGNAKDKDTVAPLPGEANGGANADSKKSKIPAAATPARKKSPLTKMATYDVTNSSAGPHASKKRSDWKDKRNKPSSYVDVTTDSIQRHSPSNLPDPAVYVDVTGVDPLQPAYMGMTVEQWRAFKRQQQHDENEFAYDDQVGNVGDDGDDW